MTITNGYVTLAQAKSWIGLSDFDDDDLIDPVINTVSRWIDNYCNRFFFQQTATVRQLDTKDGFRLVLGAFNDLVSVTTIKTDENNDGVYEVTWSASDYQLLPLDTEAAPETRPYSEIRSTGRWFPIPWGWPTRVGLIEVTGTWGWPAVPDTVVQACRLQVSRILKRKQSPEGVAGWGEFGPMRISGRLDPDVAMLLNDYRLPVVA